MVMFFFKTSATANYEKKIYDLSIESISGETINFRDYKNKLDLFNYKIKIKNSAITDELAGAAELIMGQGNEGRPIVTVRGLPDITYNNKSVSQDMFVPENEDIFKNCLCNSHKTV